MYVAPEDFITETDKTLEDLIYLDDSGALVTILPRTSGLLKPLKHFVAYQVSQGVTINKDDIVNITQKKFNSFWISSANNNSPIVVAPVPLSSVCPPPIVDLVKEFKHGIKRDPVQFSTVKDGTAWDNWNQSTIAQAQAQDIIEVLDSNYIATTVEDTQLFDEKQKFMYAVFEKTLLTGKGKALVHQHQQFFDA